MFFNPAEALSAAELCDHAPLKLCKGERNRSQIAVKLVVSGKYLKNTSKLLLKINELQRCVLKYFSKSLENCVGEAYLRRPLKTGGIAPGSLKQK